MGQAFRMGAMAAGAGGPPAVMSWVSPHSNNTNSTEFQFGPDLGAQDDTKRVWVASLVCGVSGIVDVTCQIDHGAGDEVAREDIRVDSPGNNTLWLFSHDISNSGQISVKLQGSAQMNRHVTGVYKTLGNNKVTPRDIVTSTSVAQQPTINYPPAKSGGPILLAGSVQGTGGGPTNSGITIPGNVMDFTQRAGTGWNAASHGHDNDWDGRDQDCQWLWNQGVQDCAYFITVLK